MTSGQKTAVSLLTSVLVFAAFTVFAFTGLFSVIDARFYEPGKIAQIQKGILAVAEKEDPYDVNFANHYKSFYDFEENCRTDTKIKPNVQHIVQDNPRIRYPIVISAALILSKNH